MESNPGSPPPLPYPVFVTGFCIRMMVCTSLSMVCSDRQFDTNLAMNSRILAKNYRMIYPVHHPVQDYLNHDEIFSWFGVTINVEYHVLTDFLVLIPLVHCTNTT